MAETNAPIDQVIRKYDDPITQVEVLYGYPAPTQIATYSTKLPKKGPKKTVQIDDASEIARKYSKTESYNRVLCDSPTANLRFFYEPSGWETFDLEKGYDSLRQRDSKNEYLGLLLECLDREGLVGKSDFVAKRGCFVDIAGTPLRVERKKRKVDSAGTELQVKSKKWDYGVKILVQKLDNVYYLFRFDFKNPHDKNSNQHVYHQSDQRNFVPDGNGRRRFDQAHKHVQNDYGRRFDQAHKKVPDDYTGRKYETYVTVKKGESKPDSDTPMDYNFELNSVVYSKLGEHSVILAGEVDCCLREDTSHYVQIKKEGKTYKQKYLKWWLQSFLIGCKEIQQYGKKRFPVTQLPSEISDLEKKEDKEEDEKWNLKECIDYLEKFLSLVKKEVEEELVPHVFVRPPDELEFSVEKYYDGQFKFLPLWFTAKRA